MKFCPVGLREEVGLDGDEGDWWGKVQKYEYKIKHIDKTNKWIYVEDMYSLYNEADAFIHLIKAVSERNGGNIINVGEMQYRITNDKFDLIYQWDDLFGIVILYKDSDKIEEVIADLENVFAF